MLLMKYLSFAGGDDAGDEQFTSSISPTLKMMDYMDQDAEDEDCKNSKGGEDNQSEKFHRRAKCSTHPLWLPQEFNQALRQQCTCVDYVRSEQ